MSENQPPDEALDEGLEPPAASFTEDPSQNFGDLDDNGRIRVGEDPPDEDDEDDDVTTLTDEEREQFGSLLTIGKRVKKITVLDRPVIISSLMVDDVIRVGAKTQEYRDTQAYPQAYQAAMCAASIKSVDGQSWENTLEADPDADVLFDQKWRKVLAYYPLVIQYIYNEVITLDAEFAELATKLGKL